VRRPRNKAASLITTLLVLVLLSAIVVAFMQSMSIDRLTAKSAKNILQAELAARAGLSSAIAQMLAAIGTNNVGFVTGSTNYANNHGPLVVIGRTNLVDSTQVMPLVSASPGILENFPGPAWPDSLTALFSDLVGTNSTDINGRSRHIQSVGNVPYRAPWVDVLSSSGERVGRYAFLVLDENARVNPLIHTGSGSMANPTNWYGGPGDISLTNDAAPILTREQQSGILAISNRLLSPGSLAQAFATRADYERVKHLLTLQTNATYDVIPAGLADGGRPKYNINELATNSANGASAELRADRIAQIVSSNLASFSGRDPSLRGDPLAETRYLRRLAAGMVDYIDSDSTPTAVNGGEPAGRDLFPLVVAVAERFRRASLDLTAAATTIESQCFVQVWNPYTTDVVLSNQSLRFVVRNRMKVKFAAAIARTFEDYDRTIATNLTIRPNEFAVLEFPPAAQTWSSPGPANDFPKWDAGPSGNADGLTHCPFEFYIDGQLVDMNRRPPVGPDVAVSGMVRYPLEFTDSGDRWQCSFIPTEGSLQNWRFVGDGRATYLCNYDWLTLGNSSYSAGTRWKGRQQNTPSRYQEFAANWVQRDFIRDNPAMGNTPASLTMTPSQVASAYDAAHDGPAAPAVLANKPMRSIGELGHIFDPAQAADDLSAPISSDPLFPNNKVSGGGRTLRIGQPEFRGRTPNDDWNTSDRRAIRLLDLFTVNGTNANSEGYPTAIGRINPNTAPAEILASILSGIQVASDSGIPAASLKDAASIAGTLVSNRPYSTLSDLHKALDAFAAAGNYGPAFPVSVGGGTTNLAALDRVREEAFGKLIQHLSVQSRTYRVLAVGEAFDPRGRPRGHATIEAIVFLENQPGGGVRPIITFQRSF
jgi:type II secretory pathway pseudopilin PulG